MSTRYQGRLTVGNTPSPDYATATTMEAVVPAVQFIKITYDGTLVQNGSINIPLGSQITSLTLDVLTAYNSATSATLTVGTASADTTYLSGFNAKTGGRTAFAPTAAQATALQSVASTTVTATVTSVGQPTAGVVLIAVHYVPASN